MIKVVLWDIDGTILNFDASEQAAIYKCFELFDLGKCTKEMLEDYASINKKYWKMLENNIMTKSEILVERFIEFFKKYGIDHTVANDFNNEYQYRLGDTIVFYPDSLKTLLYLKDKVVQCAVTNGTKKAQNRKLIESHLVDVFDDIFISEDVGFEKPNLEFFNAVFDTIGDYKKDEIIIVGDSLTSDMRGGNNAGIKTVWFNPKNVKNTEGVHCDYEIHSIAEVLDIINHG